MLVKFMKGPGVTIGCERIEPTTMYAPKADGTKRSEFHTTFSKRKLVADRQIVAAMVILPIDLASDADALAAEIHLEQRGETIYASFLTPQNTTVRASITKYGCQIAR